MTNGELKCKTSFDYWNLVCEDELQGFYVVCNYSYRKDINCMYRGQTNGDNIALEKKANKTGTLRSVSTPLSTFLRPSTDKPNCGHWTREKHSLPLVLPSEAGQRFNAEGCQSTGAMPHIVYYANWTGNQPLPHDKNARFTVLNHKICTKRLPASW